MSFDGEKNIVKWEKFFGGISNDDKITKSNQVVFSNNINLKKNSDFIEIQWVADEKLLTNEKYMNGFLNITSNNWQRRTCAYWEDGNIFFVDGMDNIPAAIIPWGENIMNAIEFNGNIYFVESEPSNIALFIYKAPSNDAYWWTFTFTSISTGINGNISNSFPIYNYLDSFLYIASWKSIYRESSDGTSVIFNFGTDDIVSITHLWGVFRLYQKDGRILFWDGINDSIDSSSQVNDFVREVIQHNGVDYIVWWSWARDLSNFYYMNGYRAEKIESAVRLGFTQPWENEINKFSFVWSGNNNSLLSHDGQIILINSWERSSIWTYWNIKPWYPICFESLNSLSPDEKEYTAIYAVWKSIDGNAFYISYHDYEWDEAISRIDLRENTKMNIWTVILPVFDGRDKNLKKQIESIQVYARSLWGGGASIDIKASIDWWEFILLNTLTTNGRTIIYDKKSYFFDISFQIDLKKSNSSSQISPKLYSLKLKYSLIEPT